MRQRSFVPHPLLAFLALAASSAAVACGGVPFEDAPGSTQGDDGGAETSTITVGPPGSTPSDAGPDSTIAEHPDASVDAHPDAEPDATPEVDSGHDGATDEDATTAPDSSEPIDSALPDAAPTCDGATPTLCGATCVDEQTDPAHCGSCSKVCSDAGPNATNECIAAKCEVACDPGYQLCAVSGASTCVAPDTVHGVFVSKSSVTTGCGSSTAPCGTIASGITVAKTQGLTIMYLASGTYPEQVTLPGGLTIEGGWFNEGGGDWVKECDGTTDPSSLAIIQPTSIASGPAATVLASGVTATLSTLTVKSLATAAAGQSLYGVFATSGATLTMNAVEVSVAAGGAGAAGGSGTAPAALTPPCAASDGKNGASVANGTPVAATYSSSGYAPGNGNAGTAGAYGDNETAGDPGTCDSSPCSIAGPTCTGTVTCTAGSTGCGCSSPGTSGCGGAGGAPGTGGRGGGASIALFASGATVSVTGGSLAAANGGAGGAGGSAGTAPTTWSDSAGAVGAGGTFDICQLKTVCVGPSCSTVCGSTTGGAITGGGAGGNGGHGSAGGAGASGTGGDSYAYYSPPAGGGAVTVTSTTLTCGSGGTSPAPVPGAAGSNGANTCHD